MSFREKQEQKIQALIASLGLTNQEREEVRFLSSEDISRIATELDILAANIQEHENYNQFLRKPRAELQNKSLIYCLLDGTAGEAIEKVRQVYLAQFPEP